MDTNEIKQQTDTVDENDHNKTDAFPENDLTLFDIMDENKVNGDMTEIMRSTSE